MTPLRSILRRLTGSLPRSWTDVGLAQELQSHLDAHTADNIRAGMKPADARRRAVLALGGIGQTREAVRDRATLPFVETAMQDIRYALRMLRHNGGFASAAILTSVLGSAPLP